MDLEARSLGPSDKQPLLMKLRSYKSDLATLKKEAKEAKAAGAGGASARSELFGDAEDPFSYGEGAGQRERLLNTTARLDRTSERIKVRACAAFAPAPLRAPAAAAAGPR